MAAIVYQEERVLRFVVLDQAAHTHHELKMGIFRWDGEDVGAEGIVFPETPLEVLQLWKDEEVVGAPV